MAACKKSCSKYGKNPYLKIFLERNDIVSKIHLYADNCGFSLIKAFVATLFQKCYNIIDYM
jgi:hypothetical protein